MERRRRRVGWRQNIENVSDCLRKEWPVESTTCSDLIDVCRHTHLHGVYIHKNLYHCKASNISLCMVWYIHGICVLIVHFLSCSLYVLYAYGTWFCPLPRTTVGFGLCMLGENHTKEPSLRLFIDTSGSKLFNCVKLRFFLGESKSVFW